VRTFGKLSYDAKSAATVPATSTTLLPLTKVVATTTLVAKLAEGDFAVPLDLDAKIERYLPEWGSGPNAEWRHRVTVRHLLTPLRIATVQGILADVEEQAVHVDEDFAEAAGVRTGDERVYSDLGIILMAEIIERLNGQKRSTIWRGTTILFTAGE